jgi:hypothetical protein
VTSRLLPVLAEAPPTSGKRGAQDDDEVPVPQAATVRKLEEFATKKLGEIVRNAGAGKSGYDEAEVAAARELLDSGGKIER